MQPKNQNAALRTAMPGPQSAALRAREDAHVAPGPQGYALMAGIVVDQAQGSAVTDVDGNTFLDFIGGIAVNALGHSHPTYVEAVQKQVAEVAVGSLHQRARVELFERLARAAPGARRAPPAAVLGRRRGGRERAAAGEVPHRQVRVRQLLGRLSRQDDGRAVADGLDVQGRARARWCRGSHLVPYADCYRCPVGLELSRLRHRLRRGRRARRSRKSQRARSPRSSSSRCRGRPATSSRPRSSCPR